MAIVKVIDPVTRLEGHLKIELTVEGGKVIDARATGTLFRDSNKSWSAAIPGMPSISPKGSVGFARYPMEWPR